jgi:hypothetical protein
MNSSGMNKEKQGGNLNTDVGKHKTAWEQSIERW